MKYNDYFLELDKKISSYDLKNLRTFYLPFLGPNSVTLYQYFADLANDKQTNDDIFKFSEISLATSLNNEEILKAKNKLEAIGLLRFFESELYQKHIIKIQAPLNAQMINQNKLISVKIMCKIGLENLKALLSKNMIYKFNKEEYVEKTSKFYEVYKLHFEELAKIADQEVILNIPKKTMQSRKTETAYSNSIKNNDFSVFNYYENLVNRRLAPTIRTEFDYLKKQGFSDTSIKHFLDFSTKINDGQVNIKYITKIANSYIAKNIIHEEDVLAELTESLAQRNKPQRKYGIINKKSANTTNSFVDFEYTEEDEKEIIPQNIFSSKAKDINSIKSDANYETEEISKTTMKH